MTPPTDAPKQVTFRVNKRTIQARLVEVPANLPIDAVKCPFCASTKRIKKPLAEQRQHGFGGDIVWRVEHCRDCGADYCLHYDESLREDFPF